MVNSNVNRFRSQIEGLKSVVTGTPASWRNERVSEETMSILKNHFREDMSRADAAALGWYTRNVLYFEQGLEQRDDVLLCRYEDLIRSPEFTTKRIYAHCNFELPKRSITDSVDAVSVGKGTGIVVSEEIAECVNNCLVGSIECPLPDRPLQRNRRRERSRLLALDGIRCEVAIGVLPLHSCRPRVIDRPLAFLLRYQVPWACTT